MKVLREGREGERRMEERKGGRERRGIERPVQRRNGVR